MKGSISSDNNINKTASHPDNAKKYSENQDRWREFSKETTEVAKMMMTDQSLHFRKLYEYLASRRAQIAKELNHGKDTDRTSHYGFIRTQQNSDANVQEEFPRDERWWDFNKRVENMFYNVLNQFSYENENHEWIWQIRQQFEAENEFSFSYLSQILEEENSVVEQSASASSSETNSGDRYIKAVNKMLDFFKEKNLVDPNLDRISDTTSEKDKNKILDIVMQVMEKNYSFDRNPEFKDGIWKHQYETLNHKLDELKSCTSDLVIRKFDQRFSEETIFILNPLVYEDDEYDAVFYQSRHNKELPPLECSDVLSSIVEQTKEGHVEFFYTYPVGDNEGNFEILNDYYRDTLESDNKKDFALNMGRMMFFLGKMLPCRLGSAGIAEWFMHSIADLKGYDLKFNFDGIGWDFNACFSYDVDQYADWFATKEITLEEKQKDKKDITIIAPSSATAISTKDNQKTI